MFTDIHYFLLNPGENKSDRKEWSNSSEISINHDPEFLNVHGNKFSNLIEVKFKPKINTIRSTWIHLIECSNMWPSHDPIILTRSRYHFISVNNNNYNNLY